MPNDLLIASKTTGLLVELRPPGRTGPRVEMVLRLAMTECYTWLGIGGQSGRVRGPRPMNREKRLSLDDNPSSSRGGTDYLRSGDKCRRLIGRAIKNSLKEEEGYRRYLILADWDKAVPRGLERAIAVAVQRCGDGGGTLKAIVDIRVRFNFVYCEAKALLVACGDNDVGGLAGRNENGGEPSCSICFEEMSRDMDEVADLPGCTHGFHFWCSASWFYKASTCPVCRCDQLQYLPPDYRDLHAKMTGY